VFLSEGSYPQEVSVKLCVSQPRFEPCSFCLQGRSVTTQSWWQWQC